MIETFIGFIIVQIFLIIMLILAYIEKRKECSTLERTKDYIYYCFRDGLSDLFYYQKKLNLHDDCCITQTEKELTKEILKDFQLHSLHLYFSNNLPKPRCKRINKSTTFFMFLLHSYLTDHQCDYNFLGYEMHSKTISRTDYGSWGVSQYEASYKLTDFAVVINKLLYISLCYLKSTPEFSNLFSEDRYQSELKSLEKIIFTKTIHVTNMC